MTDPIISTAHQARTIVRQALIGKRWDTSDLANAMGKNVRAVNRMLADGSGLKSDNIDSMFKALGIRPRLNCEVV